MTPSKPAVWFPTVRCGTGTDMFTEALAGALEMLGCQVRIDWLPLRAEYAPWSVAVPTPPSWANVVHVNSWLHSRFLPQQIPAVATVHGCVHDPRLTPYQSPMQRAYHRFLIRRQEAGCLERAKKVVAVSAYTAAATRTCFPEIENIEIIHNGVNLELFHPPEQRVRHRPFRLLYVGNWTTRKGVDLLPELMRRLGPEFELRYTADRNGAHARYALPSNCSCLGRLQGEALVRTYHEADALIFPSRHEGLPLVLLEAMACGLPVIAQDLDFNREILADGEQGLLCIPEDVASLADAVRMLASNAAYRLAYSKSVRRAVEKKFSLRKMALEYLKHYRCLIEEFSSTSESKSSR